MTVRAWVAAAVIGVSASLVSVGGYHHIKQSEGIHLTAYADPGTGGAPWTICYGHTGPEVYRGLRVTQAQCEAWLREDVMEAEAYVQRYVKVPLRQGEYDAYVSFVFNAGPDNFRTSTMLRLLNSGDRVGACKQFPRWKYANKMILQGLVVRRFAEQRMCLQATGSYVYAP